VVGRLSRCRRSSSAQSTRGRSPPTHWNGRRPGGRLSFKLPSPRCLWKMQRCHRRDRASVRGPKGQRRARTVLTPCPGQIGAGHAIVMLRRGSRSTVDTWHNAAGEQPCSDPDSALTTLNEVHTMPIKDAPSLRLPHATSANSVPMYALRRGAATPRLLSTYLHRRDCHVPPPHWTASCCAPWPPLRS
jgi:hypothetical protein